MSSDSIIPFEQRKPIPERERAQAGVAAVVHRMNPDLADAFQQADEIATLKAQVADLRYAVGALVGVMMNHHPADARTAGGAIKDATPIDQRGRLCAALVAAYSNGEGPSSRIAFMKAAMGPSKAPEATPTTPPKSTI